MGRALRDGVVRVAAIAFESCRGAIVRPHYETRDDTMQRRTTRGVRRTSAARLGSTMATNASLSPVTETPTHGGSDAGDVREASDVGGSGHVRDLGQSSTGDVRFVWLVAALQLSLFLLLAGSSTLWDRDEPRFSRAAVEMWRSGDYLVPTFNGELRPDKPAMIYWLMTLSLRTLGVTEIAVRCWSCVGAVLASVMTFSIAKRMFGRAAARWAMVAMASSIMPIYIGTAATADGVLLAWLTLALLAIVKLALDGPTVRWYVLLALAFGGAQLTKGPVGLAIPGLAIVLIALLRWTQSRSAKRLQLAEPTASAAGSSDGSKLLPNPPMPDNADSMRVAHWVLALAMGLVGFGMFAAWGIPANAATGGELAREGIGRHVIDRMHSPQEGHGLSGPAGYAASLLLYVPILIFGFFPWMLILPAGLSALLRKRVGDGMTRTLVWGWVAPTFVMMSLVATKLPHYILPVFPMLAALSGATIAQWRSGAMHERDRAWLRGGAFFMMPVGVALAVIVAATPWIIRPDGWIVGAVASVGGAALLAVTLQVGRLMLRERVVAAATLTIGMMAVALPTVSLLLLPTIERTKVSAALADAVHEALQSGKAGGADEPVAMMGYTEPSLVFYLDRPVDQPVEVISGGGKRLAQWLAEPGPALMVVTQEKVTLAEERHGPIAYETLYTTPVVNFNEHAREMQVLVIRRRAVDG